MPSTTGLGLAGGLGQALLGIVNQVVSALNSYDYPNAYSGNQPAAPGQVGIGWPFGVNLASVLQQAEPPSQWQCTVFPYGHGKDATRYRAEWLPTGPAPTQTLVANVSPTGVLSFSGTVAAGQVVQVFWNRIAPPSAFSQSAPYVTTATDTFATILAALAAEINAIGPGEATATATTLTVPGYQLVVNVGLSQPLGLEVARYIQGIMVSFWAADPMNRAKLYGNVKHNIGTVINRWIPLADGTQMEVTYANSWWSEEAQDSYSLYEAHLVYDCWYPDVLTSSGVDVEAAVLAVTMGSSETPNLYTPGPT
jgi:hypothetical protein